MPKDFAAGFEILPHHHERAQLIHATAGTMRVSTDDGVWVVPPQRAVWMPAGIAPQHRHAERHDNAHALCTRRCRGLHAGRLQGHVGLAVAARADRPGNGIAAGLRRKRPGRACRRADLVRAARPAVPAAAASDAARCPPARACQALLDAPGDQKPLEAWATTINTSARTLARRFQSETGLSFGAWRQQARVLEAMGRLGGGDPVTQIALDLGYESVSAFSAMFRRAAGASPSHSRPSPHEKPFRRHYVDSISTTRSSTGTLTE